jgi:glycine cleavage system H protein
MVPEHLHYTADHEWVEATDASTVRVGITDYAQRQLGDVVFVQLPEPGERITTGASFGEVESTKSVSDLIAPVTGEVIAANEALADQPELVNAEPYGAGWMLEVRLADSLDSAGSGLLSAAAYQALAPEEE